jgi:uncharacterized protein YjcR
MPCRTLAPRYGVTPKTIRDVWSGRTWVEATRHLWTEDEIAAREGEKAAKRKAPDPDHASDGTDPGALLWVSGGFVLPM